MLFKKIFSLSFQNILYIIFTREKEKKEGIRRNKLNKKTFNWLIVLYVINFMSNYDKSSNIDCREI